MKKLNGFRKILPDILVCVFMVILTIANVCLSIYSQSGYMYEGEYIYSGSYSDGYKKIYRLNAEYDREQNAMIMKFEEINNYPFEMMGSTDVINNVYNFSENMIVKFGELDKTIISNHENYVSFGDEGAIFINNDMYYLGSGLGSSYYMHKNGLLTELSVQVVRIVLTIITVVMSGLYLLIRVRKRKIFISKIVAGVCLAMFIAVIAVTDYSMNGSYTCNIETMRGTEVNYITINPLKDGQYLVCTSTEGNAGSRFVFEKKGGRLVNTADENISISKNINGVKFCNGDSEIICYEGDAAGINKWIPVIMSIPLIISVIMLIYKIYNESALEEMSEIPFGDYVIQDIAYINEDMSDMESYYRDNMVGEKIVFKRELFVLPIITIEDPLYKLERKQRVVFSFLKKKKLKKIVVFGDNLKRLNYFVAYDRRRCLLVQQLEGMTALVYSLGEE